MTGGSQAGVIEYVIRDIPIVVVDIETTGLHPGADRLVEISVVRLEPGREPALVLDTLINPQRPVSATEIHGITDGDVTDAPTFAGIAGDLARALTNAVLAAYNVYFDIRFLADEFSRVGWTGEVPHLCLMYMRPMLGLGRKCCLSEACRAHGIEHQEAHTAAFDALAGARLWEFYAEVMLQKGVKTFGDIANLKAYKFIQSLSLPPLPPDAAQSMQGGSRLKPRHSGVGHAPVPCRADLLHEYWDAITAAVADLELTDEEVRDLAEKRTRFGLTTEELRFVHGRVFAAMLAQALEDSSISEPEWLRLRRLHQCLQELGWAPGM